MYYVRFDAVEFIVKITASLDILGEVVVSQAKVSPVPALFIINSVREGLMHVLQCVL